MIQSPQMEPVTSFLKDHKSIFRKLTQGPIFLAQRSKTAAVLVSPELWDQTAKLINELQSQLTLERQLRLSNQRYKEMMADPTRRVGEDEYNRLLAEAGLAA
jgi:PHD/YefM family antitoxin component YafN of YafNO toxin-antitoxin module